MTAGNHLPHRRLTNSHVHSPRAQPLFRLSLKVQQAGAPVAGVVAVRPIRTRRVVPNYGGQVGAVQIGSGQNGARQVGASQVGTMQVSTRQGGTKENCVD